jgi:hypothetical protein
MKETNPLLQATLQIAVPQWQEIIKRDYDYYYEKKDYFANVIASCGDEILYKSKDAGKTAKLFNNLAQAIALMSFSPLGIDIFGLHFESRIDKN